MARSKSRAPADTTRTAVVLSQLAIKRLGAACVAEGRTQSEIVEGLIHQLLKDYTVLTPKPAARIVVPKRAKAKANASVTTEESASPEGQLNPPARLAV